MPSFWLRTILLCGLGSTLIGCGNDHNSSPTTPAPARAMSVTAPQNADLYITNHQQPWVLLPHYQTLTLAHYKQHYFAPWQTTESATAFDTGGSYIHIARYEHEQIKIFSHHPFWNSQYQRYPADWVQPIADNMALDSFPNINQPAIALHNTAMRLMPTAVPAFENPNRAGQGYPFDDLQVDNVWAGTPVRMIQVSLDKAWTLIEAPDMFGWVESRDIAPVDARFMADWQAHPWAMTTVDSLPVQNSQGQTLFNAKIGAPYPLVQTTATGREILVPVASPQTHQAMIAMATLPLVKSTPLPLAGTKENFAKLINALQGEPYLWGGLKQGRDCSGTMRDLFASFGVWLPRSSGDQVYVGRSVSLTGLTPVQKQQFIANNATPFATLIGYPGHVTLYIGNYDNTPYVFQNAWGLITHNLWGREGRAIIGHTVISPMNLGNDEFRTKTLLDKPLTIAYIAPPLSAQERLQTQQ